MKHGILALVMMCLCLPLAGAEKKKTDLEGLGFKGSVKSRKHTSFIITERFGKPVRSRGVNSHYEGWDQRGMLMERVEYDNNGRRKMSFLVKDYDEMGNPVSMEMSGQRTVKITARIDEKGNLRELDYTDLRGNTLKKEFYKHDEKGNRIEEVEYDASGKPVHKITRKYDERGNTLEAMRYDARGNLTAKTTWKYDDKGSEIEEVISLPVNLKKSLGRKYDEKGSKLEEVIYDARGNFTKKTSWKYDLKGKEIEQINFDANEKLTEMWVTKYDEEGDKLEMLKYDAGGELIYKWTYKSDENGNIIQQTEYKPKTSFGKTQLLPVSEQVFEFTYWEPLAANGADKERSLPKKAPSLKTQETSQKAKKSNSVKQSGSNKSAGGVKSYAEMTPAERILWVQKQRRAANKKANQQKPDAPNAGGNKESQWKTFKIKGLYLGMDLDAAIISLKKGIPSLRFSITDASKKSGNRSGAQDTINALKALNQAFGGVTKTKKSDIPPISFYAKSNGELVTIGTDKQKKVIYILLKGDVVNELFNAKGMDERRFFQTFMKAYKIPGLRPKRQDVVDGVGNDYGFQTVYNHTSDSGYEIRFYSKFIGDENKLRNNTVSARLLGMNVDVNYQPERTMELIKRKSASDAVKKFN